MRGVDWRAGLKLSYENVLYVPEAVVGCGDSPLSNTDKTVHVKKRPRQLKHFLLIMGWRSIILDRKFPEYISGLLFGTQCVFYDKE